MKTRRIVLFLLLAGTVLLFAGGQEEAPTQEYPPEMDAWLKEAGLYNADIINTPKPAM